MLDMTEYVEEQDDYVVDVSLTDDGNMVITYASGRVEKEKYSDHNYGFYQGKMVNQAIDYADPMINSLGIEWIKTQAVRYGLLLGGIVGLYFSYNVDIHIIIKIILTILILAGEAVNLFLTQLGLVSIEDDSIVAFAYKEYLKHLDNFKYYDKKSGAEKYIMPISDIDKHQLDSSSVIEIDRMVSQMKDMGSEPKDIRVNYSKIKRPQ